MCCILCVCINVITYYCIYGMFLIDEICLSHCLIYKYIIIIITHNRNIITDVLLYNSLYY